MLPHIKLDPWIQHMQELKKIQTCDECKLSEIYGTIVKCKTHQGMTNNMACIEFAGNKKYFERMKVN